ncbi:MAG: YkgJ family cysteine cluster protein [Chloroflexi bacterium]|nr:YkgJ family cysteine cluster protein [Chloroflexota bacterium]
MNIEVTSHYQCISCGTCCSKYIIRPGYLEARRIADGLGLSWDDFLEKYSNMAWPSPDKVEFKRPGGRCVFLVQENDHTFKCGIHSFKPRGCIEWNSDFHRPECQAGLKKYWDITVNSAEEFEGSDEAIRKFLLFQNNSEKTEAENEQKP